MPTVTVSTSANHKELTALAHVKAELEITNTSHDGLLTILISQASDFIRSYCGREFVKERVVERVPVFDNQFTITLSRRPVVTVHQIRDSTNSTGLSSTEFLIQDAKAGILFRDDKWDTHQVNVHHVVGRPSGYADFDWRVDYTAGYVPPGSTEQRTLPWDVEKACIETVKTWYLARLEDPSVIREQTGDASQTKAAFASGLPMSALRLLQPWRSIDIL